MIAAKQMVTKDRTLTCVVGSLLRCLGEVPLIDLSDAAWRKSTHSGTSNCVEVAFCADGRVAVRDSKNRWGAVLMFTAGEWEAFLGGVRGGEFDLTS